MHRTIDPAPVMAHARRGSRTRSFLGRCGMYAGTLAVLWLPALVCHSQETAATVIRTQSRLVQLDVTVLDKAGQPVTDLTQADFTVYEAGQPQSIRNFEAFNQHQLPASAAQQGINSTADLQRLAPNAPVTVLVLDELNTAFEDTSFARTQIRKYLTSQPARLAQPTCLLVATDAGFEQVQDYTTDRQRLLDALQKLRPYYPAALMRTGGSPEGRAIRFAQTLASLQQVAQASIGHKGRKNVVWVGHGFDGIDLRNEPDHQVQLVKGAAERAVNLLRDAHVTVYTIDPTLTTTTAAELNVEVQTDPADFAAETHNRSDPFSDTVSFNTLAPETGGRAFSLNNALDQQIGASVAEGSAYYSLAYVPAGEIDPKNPYRRIDVRVNRPGLIVVTRHGYFTQIPPLPQRSTRQQAKVEGFDLGNAISSKMAFTGIGMLAAPSAENPSEYIVQVNTSDLTWEPQPDGQSAAHLVLVAVALDAKGKPLAKNAKEVNARVGAEVSFGAMPFATLRIEAPEAKNAVRVRLALLDRASGKLGTADVLGR